MNYLNYDEYLIEAKRALERAKRRSRPGALSSRFWQEVSAAMDDYEFANEAWSWKFEGEGVHKFIDSDEDKYRCSMVHERYPNLEFLWLPPFTSSYYSRPGHWFTSVDRVVQAAWSSASQHIANADDCTSG